jgi:hypothetical protein
VKARTQLDPEANRVVFELWPINQRRNMQSRSVRSRNDVFRIHLRQPGRASILRGSPDGSARPVARPHGMSGWEAYFRIMEYEGDQSGDMH